MKQLLRYRNDVKLCFIDFETMNLCLNFVHNLPWQAAMLNVVGSKIISSDNIFIKWDTDLEISREAAEITRYDHKVIENQGVSPEEAFKIIYRNLEDCEYIVGHNTLGFDIYLIYEFYKLFNKNPRHLVYKFIDTNAIAKGIELGIPFFASDNLTHFQYKAISTRAKGIKTKLKIMAEKYNIPFDENKLHDGLYDLIINLEVWNKLKFQIEI